MADQLWRRFRTWLLWAQIAGWFFGFWVLVPLLIWRTSWGPAAKTALTAAFLLFVGTAVVSSIRSRNRRLDPDALYARVTGTYDELMATEWKE